LRAAINAERGGKVVSLMDSAGVEWLAQAARTGVVPGGSFLEGEMAGWDECAPTVTACEVDGHRLPDHGDAWDVPWVEDGQWLRHTGTAWPYRLDRAIRPTASGGLRFGYRATALAAAVPFMWVAHPQFAAPADTRVEFPQPPGRVVDVTAPGWPVLAWEDGLGGIDAVAPGGCRKLYVHPAERVSSVDLVRPDGARLRLTWPAQVPYLGLWFDQSACAAGPVIAIEPCLAYADSLAVAIELGTAPTLKPGEPLTWWIDIGRL
jgi:hypothetical protein